MAGTRKARVPMAEQIRLINVSIRGIFHHQSGDRKSLFRINGITVPGQEIIFQSLIIETCIARCKSIIRRSQDNDQVS